MASSLKNLLFAGFGRSSRFLRPTIDGTQARIPTVSSRYMSAEAGEASSSSAPSYPFSSAVITPRSAVAELSDSSILPRHLIRPKNGKAVVDHVNEVLLKDYDPEGLRKTMFSRRHPMRARPGAVMSVVSYTTPAKTNTTVFSGVLLGIRRRGVDTSFTLRNVVNKTGVELSFKVHSPMIKDIQMVKNADGKRGGLRNLGRARVNYLRDKPELMSQIAAALKQK